MYRALDDRGEELLGKLRADTDERVGLLNYFLLIILTLFKLHFFGSYTNEPFNFIVRHAVVLNELLANVAYLRGDKVCVNAVLGGSLFTLDLWVLVMNCAIGMPPFSL